MFTDCPSCEQLFRIRAAQLGAADGWVKCGSCGELFYALERLHDAPFLKPTLQERAGETAAESPAVSIDPEQPEASVQHIDLSAAEPVQQEEAVTGPVAEPGRDKAAAPDPEEPESGPTVRIPDGESAVPQEPMETGTADTQHDAGVTPGLPPALRSHSQKKAGSPAPVIWGSLIFVLSVFAAAQLAWFNRDRLAREFPVLAPWVKNICERLQCEPVRFRDVSAIKLLDKEVLPHPRYRNALLASATIANQSGFIQPFPEIELVIFATDGRIISSGRFEPEEYLGPDSGLVSGMFPGTHFHFELELAGPVREAVSFQFRFH